MAGTHFLAIALKFFLVDGAGTGDTAQCLGQYYIGAAMNNAVGLECASICGHCTLEIVIADLGNLNTELVHYGIGVHQIVDLLNAGLCMPDCVAHAF